jgi:type I restriction enzyme M protein
MLQNNPILKTLINSLWNTLWSGGIANPLTAIEQITYLLFMKRLDDMEIKLENDATFLKEKYISNRFGGIFIPHVEVNRTVFQDGYVISSLEENEISELKKPRSKQELR